MKKSVLLLLLILTAGFSQAQNVAINSSGNLPDASAMLDIDQTGKGLLIPRMTTAQRPASPATSLIIYNTTLAWFEYWDGTAWVPFLNSSTGWTTSGNTVTGTLPASPNEWIGTINAADWIIKTTNAERMRVDATGNVGIGTNAPADILHVSSATLSRFRIQNTANGGIADVVWQGKTSGGASQIYQLGMNLSNSGLEFYDATSLASRMIISQAGLVGIGTAIPSTLFHVYQANATAAMLLEGTGVGNAQINFNAGGEIASIIQNQSNNIFGFRNAGSGNVHLAIDQSGNVGIGTLAPTGRLSVVQNVASSGAGRGIFLMAEQGAATLNGGSVLIGAGNNGVGGGTNGMFQIGLASLNAESLSTTWMTVDQSGEVGIGITAPTSLLHVVGAQPGGSFIAKIHNGTSDGELIQGINHLGNEAISWRTDAAGGFMAVCTAAGTRSTTIASSSSYFLGALAIGTTSVSAGGALFEVAGQVKITGGTPGAGKVLTSDATGLASWSSSAPASNFNQSISSSSSTTTSSSFGVINTSITTVALTNSAGHSVQLFFTGDVSCNVAGNTVKMRFTIDGAPITGGWTGTKFDVANSPKTISMTGIALTPSAVAHTYAIEWMVDNAVGSPTATLSNLGASSTFIVIEQ